MGSIAFTGELDADCVAGWGDDGALAAEAALSLEHPTPVRERARTKAAPVRRYKLTRCAPCRTEFKTDIPLAESRQRNAISLL
jgi:hypothetical protein